MSTTLTERPAAITRDAIRDLYDDYYGTLDEVRLHDWPEYFTQDCLYRVIPRENFNAYLGTGLGVHFLSNEARVGTTESDDSFTKGGLTLLAGASFANTSRFGNFLELKAHFVGGYRQIKLNMGLSWNR